MVILHANMCKKLEVSAVNHLKVQLFRSGIISKFMQKAMILVLEYGAHSLKIWLTDAASLK